ncbi:PREDICTED: diuretic hormone receptor-like, partial [Nicrophorus vespilloides]|uniref:Diuretic hormone receptor-like n=1 Tax=Nicrophorus vespilloides TaxID=110193 RepID=A0ABM1MDA5_NICVS
MIIPFYYQVVKSLEVISGKPVNHPATSDLKCLRNTIHTNLMCAYGFVYTLWILTLIFELNFESHIACVILIILLHYFHLTTFFWMFVEGLYLYILVVETLTRENFKLRVYSFIGW